jgi:hypothetical protein
MCKRNICLRIIELLTNQQKQQVATMVSIVNHKKVYQTELAAALQSPI